MQEPVKPHILKTAIVMYHFQVALILCNEGLISTPAADTKLIESIHWACNVLDVNIDLSH